MIAAIRKKYNETFKQAHYESFVQHLNNLYQQDVVFRIAETPMFVDKNLKQKLVSACEQIVDVIVKPNFKEITEKAIPKNLRMQNEGKHPHFICIDFGICQDEQGNFIPKLIELQGFPSLYAWEDIIGLEYKKWFYCPDNFSHYSSGLNHHSYLALLRKTIIGNCNPEQVILMDLKPHEQKTRIDFYATVANLGIPIVCLSELIQKGNKVFYQKEGKEIAVKRIYNRLIFDDLAANPDFTYSINLQDDLDVEWITHPHWFYRISKYTMPFLRNKFVPNTYFLHELKSIPTDLENYVLKPLFSFSGMGVIIDVKPADMENIKDPENWILQEKVNYAAAIQSPVGGVKCEIRMMYLWPDGDERPTLATNLGRMSRGKMIGVRYNKDFDWVGGNIAFFEE
ncbi:MAG: hypothetical protein V4538_08580 [Bacteroidota bacterium]